MRISYWSSDLCSSDRSIDAQEIADRIVRDVMTIIIAEGEESMIVDMHLIAGLHVGKAKEVRIAPAIEEGDISGLGHRVEPPTRSEERRGGKERVSTCRSRWSPSH